MVSANVTQRRSAHARRQSVLNGSAFFEDADFEEIRPKSGRAGRQLRSAKILAEIRAENQVLDSDFYKLVILSCLIDANNYFVSSLNHRVDKMEITLVPLSYNLDMVLKRLESVFKDRKLRKQDLEKIFDSIVKNDDG